MDATTIFRPFAKATAILICTLAFMPQVNAEPDKVFVDPQGVMRWSSNKSELALFGANYCLPSALDYRAVGFAGADRKRTIEQDMVHFNRMGFDGLRVCFWGDWENSDENGNLIANDHLDLMDYLIYQAHQRGIHMLLSPIVTYSSLWPDLQDDPAVKGFSRHFEKSVLGTDPKAIAAQQNYLRQLLEHVNPYTHTAIKDEPNILFIELINEPWHHSNDRQGSIDYINALVKAVRDTGCKKLTFFNLSQDFAMAGPIHDSQVDGSTFAWYPSGLNAGHELHGNFLRYLDTYPHMDSPQIQAKPRLVYEFDLPDVISGYHYPAMVREFRQHGAQFAAMFSYDMLPTAPYNLGWTTHLLNMIYTPRKAAAAIVAAEAMRELPLGKDYGSYPANCHFGNVRVSYEENESELVSDKQFLYSNDTQTSPPNVKSLERIVGMGSSPIVQYDGLSVYFLDRIDDGRWRLEVYPDAVEVSDPFNTPKRDKICFRLVKRSRPMVARLEGLGADFKVVGLNEANHVSAYAAASSFEVTPGVYLLSRRDRSDTALPQTVHGLGLREFVCPEIPDAPASVLPLPVAAHATNEPLQLSCRVASNQPPKAVTLRGRMEKGGETFTVPMRDCGQFKFVATVSPEQLHPGTLLYAIEVEESDGRKSVCPVPADNPSGGGVVGDNACRVDIVETGAPVTLYADWDGTLMHQTRAGWAKPVYVPGSREGHQALRVGYAADAKFTPEDFSRSMDIGDRVAERSTAVKQARSIRVRVKSETGDSAVHLTLVDRDGAGWSTLLKPGTSWKELTIPISDFKSDRWAMLPQAFPDGLAYWSEKQGAESMNPSTLERLQFSLRKSDLGSADRNQVAVDVESVELIP